MRFRSSMVFGVAFALAVAVGFAGQETLAHGETKQSFNQQARVVLRDSGVREQQLGEKSKETPTTARDKVRTRHETAAIPFQTIRRETDLLYQGQRHILSYGVKGLLRRTITFVYHNGKLVRRHVATQVIRKPKSETILIGDKVRPKMTSHASLSGRSEDGFDVIKSLTVEATAYVGGGVTATGVVAQPGVIAVDPSIIPLGTKLYIPGIGVVRAEDTGGAIVGNHIDICMASYSAAIAWGVKTVQVYEIK